MNENIQKKLSRVRPPRVHITYDLETDGGIIQKELPCVIGIIGDYSGYRTGIQEYKERNFIFLDQSNFDDIFKTFAPKAEVFFELKGGKYSHILEFKNLEDFKPINIIRQIPILKEDLDLKIQLSDLQTRILNNPRVFVSLESFVKNTSSKAADHLKDFPFTSSEQRIYLISLFEASRHVDFTGNLVTDLQEKIHELNTELTLSLDTILHQKSLKTLEGSWRGLNYLLRESEVSSTLKLRVFNCNFQEIYSDLKNVMEFDSSYLFHELYEKEFGTYGGNPFTFLLVDFFMEQNNTSVEFMRMLSSVVACAHLPTVLGVSPDMFNLDSFETLHIPRDIAKIFESPELIKFKSFRELEDARYIGLVLPSFMSRLPYGSQINPAEGLNYEESILSHEDFCWSNSVYAFGQRIASSFERYHWFAAILGPENGGMVTNLPIYNYKSKNGDMLIKCPTEVAITDRREKELSSAGFTSLCYCKDTDYSVFFSCQSAHLSPVFNKSTANSNAVLSSRINYITNTARFAHYIKCIMRDKLGSFSSQENLIEFLNNWIANYVLGSDFAADEVKAQYPLREAKISVEEDPNSPGSYNAVIHLRPHFQMEELTVSLRLVAKIPGQEQ